MSLPSEALRPPAQVAAPAGLDNLAVRPGLFVGRTGELDRLDAALATPGGAVVQAVHGLGGIGKSTLAAHWAATRPHGCAPIRWITADKPASVQRGLADLTGALQPALTGTLPVEALAEWSLQWLATHTGWLLILDNVNDPADIAPLLARAHAQGRFLITSRLATAWHHIPTVCLDVLDEADALHLLTRITTATAPGRDLEGATDLCAELGRLPLAVEQAAAYLAQNPLTTPRAYLALLNEHPAAMYRTGAVGITPPERTIARIWNITLDRITLLRPETANLLRALAWYAPDNIPTTLAGGPDDPPALNTALGLLTAYSMITPDPSTGTLAVHRLVQALARTPDPDDPHRAPHHIQQAREQATANLHSALPAGPGIPASWPTWRTLLPHIDALTEHAGPDTDTATTADILNRTGLFVDNQGMPTRASWHYQRALAAYQRLLGEDHPKTLASRNNLASAYREAGDLDRAIPLSQQTLADAERVLGEDHLFTLLCRHNLASTYQEAGDLGRAIPVYEQAMEGRVRVLGEDDHNTLTVRHNLAHAYGAALDPGRAIPLYEQAVKGRVRELGEDHPDTLNSCRLLAEAYQAVEDADRAVSPYEQTVKDRVRELGEDHPDTLASRHFLARAYGAARDMGRAIPLLQQLQKDQARVLGEDHPDTLKSRNLLACCYGAAGNPGRAIPLYEQTVQGRGRVLGEDHPDTLRSRIQLAYTCRVEGDLHRAILLYKQILTDCERAGGEEDALTVAVRDTLTAAIAQRDDRIRPSCPKHGEAGGSTAKA
ncbi:FxSxx-COOH system tetratricopeptide repeat protein [Streptomyces sp. NPDC002580]|uniref:FxSxx-COOH system tetratricopeptide repeat protein n=1 Tax=Streptomyces sp. NPDC002580 TaxID=3364653 RepID=UPI003697BE95